MEYIACTECLLSNCVKLRKYAKFLKINLAKPRLVNMKIIHMNISVDCVFVRSVVRIYWMNCIRGFMRLLTPGVCRCTSLVKIFLKYCVITKFCQFFIVLLTVHFGNM